MADALVDEMLAEVYSKGFSPSDYGYWGFGFDLSPNSLELFGDIKSVLVAKNYSDLQIGEVNEEKLLLVSMKKYLQLKSGDVEAALNYLDSLLEPVDSRINQFVFLENETRTRLNMESKVKDELLNSVNIKNIKTGETYARKDGVFQKVSNFFSKKGK